MEPLSSDLVEAMVQCFGKCFHFKDGMRSFLAAAGVPAVEIQKHAGEPKFVWARRLLTDLAATEDGRVLQRRILTNLCKLRDLPDKEVADRDAGLDRLRDLKKLAREHQLVHRM
jgi:hypothetical protein